MNSKTLSPQDTPWRPSTAPSPKNHLIKKETHLNQTPSCFWGSECEILSMSVYKHMYVCIYINPDAPCVGIFYQIKINRRPFLGFPAT